MNIFIDTNIFLDVILKRENYKESLAVLNNCKNDSFKGFISDVTILNIDYIARQQVKELRDLLTVITNNFVIIGADNDMFYSALEMENPDLEDNIQYCSAKSKKCEIIITNDKSFCKSEIKVMSSNVFVAQYLQNP